MCAQNRLDRRALIFGNLPRVSRHRIVNTGLKDGLSHEIRLEQRIEPVLLADEIGQIQGFSEFARKIGIATSVAHGDQRQVIFERERARRGRRNRQQLRSRQRRAAHRFRFFRLFDMMQSSTIRGPCAHVGRVRRHES